MFFVCVGLQACGVTKEFVVQTVPTGALVTEHDGATIETSTWGRVRYHTETPAKISVDFESQQALRTLTIEKRGYESTAVTVHPASQPNISVVLKKLEGAADDVLAADQLGSLPLLLLPVDIRVRVNTAPGEIPTKSDEDVSKQVSRELAVELGRQRPGMRTATLDESLQQDFVEASAELRSMLFKYSPERLRYYSRPLIATAGIRKIADKLALLDNEEPLYYLYVSGACESETSKRRIIRVGIDVAGFLIGAMSGAVNAYGKAHYNYSPVTPYTHDPLFVHEWTKSLLTLAVINAATSEIVYLHRQFLDDITDGATMKTVTEEIIARLTPKVSSTAAATSPAIEPAGSNMNGANPFKSLADSFRKAFKPQPESASRE